MRSERLRREPLAYLTKYRFDRVASPVARLGRVTPLANLTKGFRNKPGAYVPEEPQELINIALSVFAAT